MKVYRIYSSFENRAYTWYIAAENMEKAVAIAYLLKGKYEKIERVINCDDKGNKKYLEYLIRTTKQKLDKVTDRYFDALMGE